MFIYQHTTLILSKFLQTIIVMYQPKNLPKMDVKNLADSN